MVTAGEEVDFLGTTPIDTVQMQAMFVKMADRIRQLEAEVNEVRASTKKLIPRGDVYIGKA